MCPYDKDECVSAPSTPKALSMWCAVVHTKHYLFICLHMWILHFIKIHLCSFLAIKFGDMVNKPCCWWCAIQYFATLNFLLNGTNDKMNANNESERMLNGSWMKGAGINMRYKICLFIFKYSDKSLSCFSFFENNAWKQRHDTCPSIIK